MRVVRTAVGTCGLSVLLCKDAAGYAFVPFLMAIWGMTGAVPLPTSVRVSSYEHREASTQGRCTGMEPLARGLSRAQL